MSQGFAQDVDQIVADNLASLQQMLEDEIAGMATGGDPTVITNIQADIDALQTAQADVAAQVADKADTADVTAAISTAVAPKADTATVNTQLGTKADTSAVNAALALKADLTALTSGLAGKVSQSTYDAFVSATNASLATKASSTSVTDLSTTVSGQATDISNLTSAIAAKLTAIGAVTDLTPGQMAVKYVVHGDATATTTWSNRWEMWYTPNGGASRLVAWFNEYGELRLIPGNSNTVALRIYNKATAAEGDHTGYVFEIVDHQDGTRTTVAGFDGLGNMLAKAITATSMTLSGNIAAANHMDFKGVYAAAPSTTGWAANAFWWLTTGETTLP